MKYYAKYDYTTSINNPGHGFSNTEIAVCFFSQKDRDTFVENRYFDLSCQAIYRDTAISMAEKYDGRRYVINPAKISGNEPTFGDMVFI